MRSIALSAGVVVASVAPALGANLLTNPGFESGLAGWTFVNPAHPLPPADWGLDSFAFAGMNSVRFGHAGALTVLKQDVPALVPGQQYELSFWAYNLGIDDDVFSAEMMNASETQSQEIIPFGFLGTGLESWTQVSVTFTAQQGWERLRILGRDNAAAYYLDEFDLSAVVPAPAGAAAVLLGVAGLNRRRRR